MDKIYHGYLCNLRIDSFSYGVYVVREVTLIKKEDKYYTADTNETYDVITINKQNKLNYHEEGLYFADVVPYEEFIERNKPKTRKRK